MDTSGRIKVIVVIPSRAGGGAERVVETLVDNIDRTKFNTTCVILGEGSEEDGYSNKAPTVFLGKEKRSDVVKIFFKLIRIINREKPDIVLGVLYYSNILIAFARIFTAAKFYFIASIHNFKELSGSNFIFIKRLMLRYSHSVAGIIITVSHLIEKDVKCRHTFYNNKTVTIYNPIDIDAIRGVSEKEVSHPFLLNKKIPLVIIVGRLCDQKRIDRFLWVVRRVVKIHRVDIRGLILGEGPKREELEGIVRKYGIAEHVDFLGFVDNPYAWMRRSSICMLTSDFEGLPMVIFESMACGTPIISTDCPSGPKEIITHGQDGILVPLGDDNKLVRALLDLLGDNAKRSRIVKNASERVKDFSADRVVKYYERVFYEAVQSNK